MGMITARARGMDLFHRISHWIAISEAQKREHVAMGIPQERITVVPHFYESEVIAAPASSGEGDALYVGRLSPEKGVDRLIRAWKLIQDCGRTLWIVGEGPERPRLEAMIGEEKIANVRFTGFLNQQEMAEIWTKASCSIVPSIWKEPFGMVVLEAWAKGRPVVAHRIGALPEIIGDGVNGLLVPENSPGELAEAILSLLKNPVRAGEMGRAGLQKLKERYSKNVWMDAMKPVLSNLTRMKA
jgi:glycosyltransferase involved in cell wall biosynthesis